MYICDFKHTYQIYEADYCLKHFNLFYPNFILQKLLIYHELYFYTKLQYYA